MPKTENKPNEFATTQSAQSIDDGVKTDTSQTHYTVTEDKLKSLLCEVHGSESDRKSINRSYDHRKQQTELLADAFSELSFEYKKYQDAGLSDKEIMQQYCLVPRLGTRSMRVRGCGTTLEFWKLLDDPDAPWKLHKANFCRDRLCPMCMYRRSLKIFGQTSDILNHVDKKKYDFLFLTLTVPNCNGEELESVCKRLISAFGDLLKKDEVKKVVNGYFRALEVTFNHKYRSKSFMTFHPHLHVILAVPKSYFKKSYIKRDDWLQMWRDCYDDQTITQVFIEKVKSNNITEEMYNCADLMEVGIEKAIAETAKYSVKASDYLFARNKQMTNYAVKYFSYALRGLRLFAFGGVFQEISKMLNQEDVMSDNADLIHVSADDYINPFLAYMVVKFRWGDNRYNVLSVDRINQSIGEVC